MVKICIYGAGAVGTHLAVNLIEAGLDVSVIARGPHLMAIREKGLTLITNNIERNVRIPTTNDPAKLGVQDFLIITLKSHQAWDAARQMAPLIGPDTAVVTAQNGIPWWYFYALPGQYENHRLKSIDPDDRQWNTIGPERVIGCTVYAAAEIIAPGIVKHTYGDRYGLGEPTGKQTPRLEALAGAFQSANLKPRLETEIRNDIWLKLWGNLCFNPISILTRATLDVIATDPGTRHVATLMMKEAQQIAQHIGATFRVGIDRRIDGAASVGPHRTSMLQDFERGRPIELDALLTVVQEIGQLCKIGTPAIDTVLALTRQLGRTTGVYPTFPDQN